MVMTREWLIVNMKMALTHQLTDIMIHQGDKAVGRRCAKYISSLSEIHSVTVAEARSMVLDCLNEARLHVTIFNEVSPEGMGRQTQWFSIIKEELQTIN
jgi:hypothetical protein